MASQVHVKTPVWFSRPMTKAAGTPVYLKMEALQPVGSFKARGMGAACAAAYKEGVRQVVCASGGNAGYAVAYAGRQLGLHVTIVVPETTPEKARSQIRAEGADVLVQGASWDDAHEYAVKLAAKTGARMVHPFDDPQVWRGHASLIHELAESGHKPELLVVSVGGGGLLVGALEGLHQVGWSDVPVLAVETEGAASFASSVKAGRLVTLERIDSLATTLGARRVAAETLAWTERHEVQPWLVSDRAAVEACQRFADDHRLLVEPACGAALSVAYDGAAPLAGRDMVMIVVCGGAGVSRALLEKWDRESR